jgi:hypothetical protein
MGYCECVKRAVSFWGSENELRNLVEWLKPDVCCWFDHESVPRACLRSQWQERQEPSDWIEVIW